MFNNDSEKPDLSIESAIIKADAPTLDDLTVEEMLAKNIDILNRQAYLQELLEKPDEINAEKRPVYEKQLKMITDYLEEQTRPQAM